MMIVMKTTATEGEVKSVIERVPLAGARPHLIRGEERAVIGAIGDAEHVAGLELEALDGVDQVMPITKPFKPASTQFRHDAGPSVLEIAGRRVGGGHFALIAGPCTVESRALTLETAAAGPDSGATTFPGGAYKPQPPRQPFQRLGHAGLGMLEGAKQEPARPIVTEVMDVRDLEPVLEV